MSLATGNYIELEKWPLGGKVSLYNTCHDWNNQKLTINDDSEDNVAQSSGGEWSPTGLEEWQEQEVALPSNSHVESETWRSRRRSTTPTLSENTSTYRHSRLTATKPTTPPQDSSLEKPFGWLRTDYKASQVSIESTGESTDNTTVEASSHKTIAGIDFDNLIDRFKCNETIG